MMARLKVADGKEQDWLRVSQLGFLPDMWSRDWGVVEVRSVGGSSFQKRQ